MSKIKILAIPPDTYAVGKFRITNPYIHLQENYGDDFHVDINSNVPDVDDAFLGYDVVVAHSFIHNNVPFEKNLERIEWLKKQGIIVVIDIDDFWSPDMRHPMFHQIRASQLPKMKLDLLKSASYITTTTPVFKNTLEKTIGLKNVYVFPNAIDENETQFKPNPTQSDKIRFGWLGGSCLTPETEILTDKGWMFFENLNGDEKVATLNQETSVIEYHKPKNYIKEQYDGQIYVCDTNEISFSVTPNHKMYASKIRYLGNKTLNYDLIKCEDLYNKNFHVKKNCININDDIEYFYLPGIKQTPYDRKNYSEKRILMDDWLSFLGFFLAEGWTDKSISAVSVCQFKNNDYIEHFKKLLEKYGFVVNNVKVKGSYDNVIRVCDKQLFEYFKQFGKAQNKFIPRDLLNNLSERQLGVLLEWYLKGDGSKDVSNKYIRNRAYTVSKQLADDLMELSFLMGNSASIKNRGMRTPKNGVLENGKERIIKPQFDAYQIGFYEKNSKHNKLNPLIRKEKLNKEYYNGYVYCVNVKNNIIYVRRNGKALWVGNSHLHDIELLRQGISIIHSTYKDKAQFLLCGFDLRGSITEIDQVTKQQRKRDIKPEETVWFNYEKIFTNDYRVLDPEYVNFLKSFKEINYNDIDKPYRRRWTKDIKSYATNYNHFDVSLAPLVDTWFNNNKSQLKAIEAGFHKKALIASACNPYLIDLVNAVDEGKFNDKGNSLLVSPSKNHKDWAKHMKRLIDNPNMIEDLGNRLYETVKDKYSLTKVNNDRADFFKTIVNK